MSIEVVGLVKKYNVPIHKSGFIGAIKNLFYRQNESVDAIKGIDISIKEGELVGLIGSNGAGKSTLLKILVGVLRPSSGAVTIDGYSPFENRSEFLSKVGVVFGQRSQLWWELPVIESYKLLMHIYSIEKSEFDKTLERFIALLDIGELINKPLRNLSLGQKMLCELVAAFIHKPKIVFLDEPTIGLDALVKEKMRRLILELNKDFGTTIIITSHDIADIESVCKRMILLEKGWVKFDGDISDFQETFGGYRTIELFVGNSNEDILTIEPAVYNYFGHTVSVVPNEVTGWVSILFSHKKIDSVALFDFMRENFEILDFRMSSPPLEQTLKFVYSGKAA